MRFRFVPFVLVFVRLSAAQGDVRTPPSPLIGQKLPDFALTDTSGRRVSLSDFQGKTLILDFWATWCQPCRDELPVLNRIARNYSRAPFVVLGINAGEQPETVRRFLEKNTLSYRTLLTYEDDSLLRKWAIESYPFIVLIDRNGVVADAANYPATALETAMGSKLRTLLSSQYVSPPVKQPVAPERLEGVVYPAPITEPPLRPANNSADELFLQASLDFQMNRLGEALKNVNSCLRTRPNWIPALRLRAHIYAKRGKTRSAMADCAAILRRCAAEPAICGLDAGAIQKLKKTKMTLGDYLGAVDPDPSTLTTSFQSIQKALRADNFEAAQTAADRAVEMGPDQIAAYQLRAQVEALRGDRKAELADIDRVLILNPANAWARTNRHEVLLSLAQPLSPPDADDTYAVYSAVLANPIWNHVDDDSLLLISEDVGTAYGEMEPGKCIQAPQRYDKQMKELLVDYAKRKSDKVKLQSRFRITRPFRLLNSAESRQFVNWRFDRKKPAPKLTPLFAKTPDLIRLSQVFFNNDHTLAMVLVSNYCGGLCGGEKWRTLLKRNGSWIEENWSVCMTIS